MNADNAHIGRDRLSVGLLSAWATSVAAAFVVGCIHTALSVRSPSGWPDLSSSGAFSAILTIAFFVAAVSAPVAAIATFVLGLPIFSFLARRAALSAASSIAAGALIALLLCILFLAAHNLTDFLVDSDFHMAIAAVVAAGPLSGLVLWLVVRQQTRSRQ